MGRLFDQEDDETVVVLAPERRTLPKVGVVLLVMLGLLVVVGVVARGWYGDQVDPPGEAGDQVEVVIPKGATLNQTGSLLADEGVISSATVFRFWVRGKAVEVQAGTYTFQEDSSFDEALAVIRKGPAPTVVNKVTVPEGLTLAQTSQKLSEQDARFTVEAMDAALADPTVRSGYRPQGESSLEGLLFPSTYEVGPKDTAATMVSRMIAQMQLVGEEIGLAGGVVGGADAVPELSPYEIITVASLIQAESGNEEESPKIARVIYNRLLAGEPLGIDATSRYLAQLTGEDVDFESDSPFNTRRNAGLPPTPIAGPGKAALTAALHPADGPWTWYVLEERNKHFFTDSQAEFLRKKQECEDKGLGCG